MSLEKVPEVDMWTVARSAKKHRRAMLDFVPRIGLSVVDYADMDRIDTFYLDCQEYRDYYRDPNNMLHKPVKFQHISGPCGAPPDTSVDRLRQPIQWVAKRQPAIVPVEGKSYMNLGIPVEEILKGRHDKESCIHYKR